MKVLVGDTWRDVRDYPLGDGYRIKVHRWVRVAPVDDAYVIPKRSLMTLWNYRKLGARPVIKKIRSRLHERGRNAKFISVGVGVVQAVGNANPAVHVGQAVLFVAPLHPAACERVVLPAPCLCPTDRVDNGYGYGASHHNMLDDVAGWTEESGRPFPEHVNWEMIHRIVETADYHTIELGTEVDTGSTTCKDVALFGYGHHVRTNVLPALTNRDITLFESDPLIESEQHPIASHTTLPPGATPRLSIVATYHHTHADIAADCMAAGSAVILEKPAATTTDGLDRLIDAVDKGGRLFMAFHKRYSPFNSHLKDDLGVGTGQTFSYHCTVHEIRLPRHHWYRWPVSGSRILSNGCHWIDHFLFLNAFAEPTHWRARRLGTSEIVCELELENGSVFTMTLTDRGSDRLGTRETIEIFSRNRTARIQDFSHYVSETDSRSIREARADKLAVYPKMYRDLIARANDGSQGESVERLRISAGTILRLEADLNS